METKAVAKHMRIAPRKVRIVADNIKGQPVGQAVGLLTFTPQKAAHILLKVVRSALANAEQHKGVDVDALVIKSVAVDEGPTLKRWRARAQGRAYRIRKRTSHITVILAES